MNSFSILLIILSFGLLLSVGLSLKKTAVHYLFMCLCANLALWQAGAAFHQNSIFFYMELGFLLVIPTLLEFFFKVWLSSEDFLSKKTHHFIINFRTGLCIFLEITLGIFAYKISKTEISSSLIWKAALRKTVYLITWIWSYYSFLPIYKVLRSTQSNTQKKHLLYLFILGMICITIASTDYLPPPFGSNGPALGSFLIIVYLYFLQQSLLLDKLLNFSILLTQVIHLFLFVAILSALRSILIALRLSQIQTISLLVSLLLILYEPSRKFVENQVHRLTSKKREEFQNYFEEIQSELDGIIELPKAFKTLFVFLEKINYISAGAIYILTQEQLDYRLLESFGIQPIEKLDITLLQDSIFYLNKYRYISFIETTTHPIKEPPINHALEKNLTVFLNDTKSNLIWGIYSDFGFYKGSKEESSYKSMNQNPLGFLCIKRISIEELSKEEIDWLNQIEKLLWTIIKNAKLYKQIQEKDRLAMIGEMAAGLAHEIRNPLSAIKGATELLRSKQLEQSDSNQMLEIVIEETNRLNQFISQFLNYAKPYEPKQIPIQLNDLLRKVIRQITNRPNLQIISSDWQEISLNERIKFLVKLHSALPNILGDPEQLQQVLWNFIQNAKEAVEQNENRIGNITVSISISAEKTLQPKIEIRIQDNGLGIEPDKLDKIFVPFYTTKEKGNGLGLALCQRIIQKHQGSIHVSSQLGLGSIFYIYLPANL